MASEIRVNKINSQTGVGTITLSPTGVDISGVTTASTLRATTGIITTLQVGTISGDGSALTGVASTENIRTNTNATFLQNINVSGSTTTGSLVSSGAISGTTGTFTSHVSLGDSDELRLGDATGGDLKIYHDGNNSAINDVGTGSLYIQGSDNIYIRDYDTSENHIVMTKNGAVDLYHNGTTRFETTDSGTRTTGAMHINDGAADSNRISVGNGGDLKIFHTNPSTYIQDSSSALVMSSTRIDLNASNGENMARFNENGAAELYHDNTKQCETSANGLAFPSGKGIDFSATSDLSGSSSELLDDYEEGTYTCVLTGSGGGTHNIVGCPYVKIGKQVSIQVTLANPGSNSVSGNWSFTMPFTAVQTSGYAYFGGYVTYTRHLPGFSEGDGNFCNYAIHTYNDQSSALLYKLRNGSGEANLVSGSLNSDAILAWTMVYNTST